MVVETMPLQEIKLLDAIVELTAGNKQDIIRELVGVVMAKEGIAAERSEELLAGVMQREALGSTGMGNGVAVPHWKKCPYVTSPVAVFGRHARGVPYGAIDGAASKYFFLLLAPDGVAGSVSPEAHLTFLKSVAKVARDVQATKYLGAARMAAGVWDVLLEHVA